MPSDGHQDALTLQVAQVALLVRLFLLFVLTLVWALQQPAIVTALVVLAALPGYVALRSRRARAFVTDHPLVVLIDAIALTVVVGIVGMDTPFVLALCTSTLLVGLWLTWQAGIVVVLTMCASHLLLLAREPLSVDAITAYVFVVPPLYVTLWLLGLAVQRSARATMSSQAVLRDATAVAATSHERLRIARDMHDSVAKSLQAMALTASSLPILVERRPQLAAQRAREIEEDCTLAIGQVRSLMGELRNPAPVEDLASAVTQVIGEWRSTTGRSCSAHVGPVGDIEPLARYELLMALREALENVHRHAGRCATTVTLESDGAEVVLRVKDDGIGSSEGDVASAPGRGHFGVVGMGERMAQVGGRLEFVSVPRSGTEVTFSVPRRVLIERDTEVV